MGVVDVQAGPVGQDHGGGAREGRLGRAGAGPGPPRRGRRVHRPLGLRDVAGRSEAVRIIGEQARMSDGAVEATPAQVGERVLALVVPAHRPCGGAVRPVDAGP